MTGEVVRGDTVTLGTAGGGGKERGREGMVVQKGGEKETV